MGSLYQQGNKLFAKQLFNEQQAAVEFQNIYKTGHQFTQIHFQNVGVKIMRETLNIFQQQKITSITIKYDWNHLMLQPKLVCYDKNTWKTLQQLANWNKQWNQLFNGCWELRNVHLDMKISWMDDQWVKSLLQGITRLPNVQNVQIIAKSKDQNVQKMIQAFGKAKIFPQFNGQFVKF